MSSAKMNDTKIYRCGVTARYSNFETKEVSCEKVNEPNRLRIHFKMDSKGGGKTEVYINIGAKDFPIILAKMIETDRQAAMEAMSSELARQVSEQPLQDAGLAEQSRNAVRKLAQEKYNSAPSGQDEAERFALQCVTRLVKELDNKEAELNKENEIPSGQAA